MPRQGTTRQAPLLLAGALAVVFARAVTPARLSFNLDAGWEYAYGQAGPYLRLGVGFPLDFSVDRSLPRLPDQP